MKLLNKTYLRLFQLLTALCLSGMHGLLMAADSYRYTHVTIETPWMIFMGLLVVILLPFILMAVLHWYFAFKKKDEDAESSGSHAANES